MQMDDAECLVEDSKRVFATFANASILGAPAETCSCLLSVGRSVRRTTCNYWVAVLLKCL